MSLHEIIFSKSTSELRRLLPFRCQVANRPLNQKLKTFATRARYILRLYHGGNVIYDVLNTDKIIRNNYVRLFEHSFSETSIFDIATFPIDYINDMESMVEYGIDDDEIPGTPSLSESDSLQLHPV